MNRVSQRVRLVGVLHPRKRDAIQEYRRALSALVANRDTALYKSNESSICADDGTSTDVHPPVFLWLNPKLGIVPRAVDFREAPDPLSCKRALLDKVMPLVNAGILECWCFPDKASAETMRPKWIGVTDWVE